MSYRPYHVDWRVLIWLSVAAALAGCSPSFKPRNFANPEALFRASLLEFEGRNWDNAQMGFERLTGDLSGRDPLLAPAYFYLALTHERKKEFLLAAQAFQRVADGFPDDTLAPGAMLGVGRSYQRQWRKPALDPEYGQKAISILRALLSSYPDAPQTTEAKERITQLEEWFAQKDYDTGIHYMRVRRAVDSPIIYFKDVVTTYPNTKAARMAWLRLHELYTQIRWKDDAEETCVSMRQTYPGDPEVMEACGEAPTPAPPPPVDTTGAVRSTQELARPAPL